MKHISAIFFLLLLGNIASAQSSWKVTEVHPLLSSNKTLTIRLVAEADNVWKDGFTLLYHKTYIVGDTINIIPYYHASISGSGLLQKETVTNDIFVGNYTYSDRFYHVCIKPYDVLDIDTNTYPPTPNPPNYCLDMKDVVSVPNTIADANISIYPNPASTYINIKGAVQSLAIYTINGQRVKDVSHPHRRISIAELPTGIYIIKLQTDDRILRRKLIVE